MSGLIRLIKHFSIVILFFFFLSACTHLPPRVNRDGTPQREYSYQPPIKIDDGWQISSLAKEGVDEGIINDLMRAVLTGKYPNVRSILLVKNGNIILEEYFYHYHRYVIQDFRSGGKSVTSELVGIAIDKGFIKGVNEKLFDYFPEFEKGTDWDKPLKRSWAEEFVLRTKWVMSGMLVNGKFLKTFEALELKVN